MTKEERLRQSVEWLRSFAKKVKVISKSGLTPLEFWGEIRSLLHVYENQWPNWLDEGIEDVEEGDEVKPINVSAVRNALGDYVRSEGCSCCESTEAHKSAAERLAKLLGVEPYDDGSGYDFYRYATGGKSDDEQP